jgi:hypothetical protein
MVPSQSGYRVPDADEIGERADRLASYGATIPLTEVGSV